MNWNKVTRQKVTITVERHSKGFSRITTKCAGNFQSRTQKGQKVTQPIRKRINFGECVRRCVQCL